MIRTCYDVFNCEPSLDCNSHIEAIFYTSKFQPTRVELCCHCAGEFDTPVHLIMDSIVLPACKMCLDNGCHIIVRRARQSAQAKQYKLDDQAVRDAARQARVMASEGAATTTEVHAEEHAKAPSKRRKRDATR